MTSDPTPAAHTLPTYDSRGIPVPLFPWIVNYGLDRFDYVASAIDALPGESTEWAKIPVLVNEPSYLTFLSELTGRSKSTIVAFLNDFADDRSFIGAFGPALAEVQSLPAAGDLRFHAITLYVIVRSARPTPCRWVRAPPERAPARLTAVPGPRPRRSTPRASRA